MNQITTVLITTLENLAWYQDLELAILSLNGKIEPISVLKSTNLDWKKYDAVFLDLANINDPINLIHSINHNHPAIKIIVFSPVPRWKQAREMLHAGAADYLVRSGEYNYLHLALKHLFTQDNFHRPTSKKSKEMQ